MIKERHLKDFHFVSEEPRKCITGFIAAYCRDRIHLAASSELLAPNYINMNLPNYKTKISYHGNENMCKEN